MVSPHTRYDASADAAWPDPDDTGHGRPAIWNEDAERAVLGAVMLAPRALAEAREILAPEDFYRPANELIFGIACALADKGKPTDTITVLRELGAEATRVSPLYLHECISVASIAVGHHAQMVADAALLRRVAAAGTRIVQAAHSTDADDIAEVCAKARAELEEALAPAGRSWPEPSPLVRWNLLVPTFPLNALPDWLKAQVSAVAVATQTPVDLAATVALSVLATACGGKIRMRLRRTWREPANLYTVSALPPGSRKSPVFTAMVAPLQAAEHALKEAAKPAIIEARLARELAEDEASRAASAVGKAKNELDKHDLLLAAKAAAHALAGAAVPAEPVLVTDDATPEALASMLADQSGRMAILSAESEIFNIIAGRYSSSPSMNVFLKGHAGDQIRVHRVGRPAETVDKPALTIGVCTQPEVLRDLAAIPGAAGRGLLARFLYSIPKTNVGYRDNNPPDVSEQVTAVYDRRIRSLVLTLADQDEPFELTVDDGAAKMQLALSERYEARMRDEGDLAAIRDWGGKAVGAALRIASLLHMAEHLLAPDGWAKPISAATITAAEQIIDYYAAHALAAYGAMTTDETTAVAHLILDWVKRDTPARFSRRDLFNKLRNQHITKVTDLDAALALLEAHGHLRRLPEAPSSPRGGRPAGAVYQPHPSLIA